MDVIFHIGAHHTDGGALLRSLLKNADMLKSWNVAVPGPSRYRKAIGTMVTQLRGQRPGPDAQAALYEELFDGDAPQRIVLSSDNFICVPERVLEDGEFYGRTFKANWLRNLFPDDDVAFAIGLRNPATLLSALWYDARLAGDSFENFLGGLDPTSIRWSEVIRRIRSENPDCPVIVWCDEDAPLIWPEVMQMVSGLRPGTTLEGEDDMLTRIMQRAGMILYREKLEETPEVTPEVRRKIAIELLETYVAVEQVEIEIDLPDWTDDMVAAMTDAYEADLAVIRTMASVVLIEP